jgi:hypothetical protein
MLQVLVWYKQKMKRTPFPILVLFILQPVFAGPAQALDQLDCMRCGSKLVAIGDTKADVLSRCGEPVMRDKVARSSSIKKSGKKSGNKKSGSTDKKIQEQSRVDEQWVYDLGPHDFSYTLCFEGVELKSIGRGGRGTRR